MYSERLRIQSQHLSIGVIIVMMFVVLNPDQLKAQYTRDRVDSFGSTIIYSKDSEKDTALHTGTADGKSISESSNSRIVPSTFQDSSSVPPKQAVKTWKNSFFTLGLAFGVGPVTSLSVGLAVEIKPIHFLSLEAITNANPGHGNFTFQARGKIYPFRQFNMNFGDGTIMPVVMAEVTVDFHGPNTAIIPDMKFSSATGSLELCAWSSATEYQMLPGE
jgi:hypothetical protein